VASSQAARPAVGRATDKQAIMSTASLDPASDPAALIRSRQYRRLPVAAALIGVPAVAALIGATAASILRLPLASVVITLPLTGSAGLASAPIVIVAVVVASITVQVRPAAVPEPASETEPARPTSRSAEQEDA
jgi:H+/Cl- antiporter ClcA